MKMLRFTGRLFLLLLIIPAMLIADEEWEIIDQDKSEDSGWILYSREIEGSNFPQFKIEGQINASTEISSKASWVNYTNEEYVPSDHTREVLKKSEDQLITYTYINLPIVFNDRDIITQIDFYNKDGDVYGLTWEEAPDLGPEVKKGVVRLPKSSGYWEFSPSDDGLTQAVCVTHTEMGGSVPAWLVKGRTADFVVESLNNMRKIAENMKQ